jgi:hypothetical protein
VQKVQAPKILKMDGPAVNAPYVRATGGQGPGLDSGDGLAHDLAPKREAPICGYARGSDEPAALELLTGYDSVRRHDLWARSHATIPVCDEPGTSAYHAAKSLSTVQMPGKI